MLRWMKYGFATFVVVSFAGFLALGTNLSSYVRTTTNAAQEAVRNSVPMDFELRRASDMINAILPDLQSQVRIIAQEEVEIAALQTDIAETQKRLAGEHQTLAALRANMDVHQVTYAVNGRNMPRQQLTEQLHQRFARLKQGELALASKQRLLEKRQDGLDAALAMLDRMRHRKAELEQKVEALAAQHRLVQASAIESGRLMDDSQLSQADQLLSDLETRLAVAQRVLAHEQDLFTVTTTDEIVDEQRLLTELDDYLDQSDRSSEK